MSDNARGKTKPPNRTSVPADRKDGAGGIFPGKPPKNLYRSAYISILSHVEAEVAERLYLTSSVSTE